ncbi:HEAT repeat domain-containing protein [Mycoavidus sp. SF9855]|uniref:HEAT repeat domain-containing protein n=1 Tax=Mycoavidus sp. SF9855 TaxID=2968475 RepID=UPI00211BA03B|nr:HEAT repeat domain-containing protein [Mycoavidus sp. SF9855]UUM22230.1 HEAT repeat domain-containing protein [Mycoavidus sp. SF9855]
MNSPRLILISAHHSLKAAQNLEDLKEREEYYVEARRLAEQAAKISSTDATKFKAKQDLAAIWFDYGRFLDMQRRFTEAEDAYRKAREYGCEANKLKQNQPKVQNLRMDIGLQYNRFLLARGRIVQADEVLKESVQIQTPASNRSCIRQCFSSSVDWVPSRGDVDQGGPSYRANNLDFERHVSSLLSRAKPFFTQRLQSDALSPSYHLPQPGEFIQETRHLAWCIQQEGTLEDEKRVWIREAEQMVGWFKKTDVAKNLKNVQEIVTLASIDNSELHRQITCALLDDLKLETDCPLNLFLLRGLSVMVFHRWHLTQDLHGSSDCDMLLRVLSPKLNNIQTYNNLEQVRTLLQTISLVLDLMIHLRLKKIDRIGVEDPLKAGLKRFDHKKKYPELAWLICYIRQALKRLPNNEALSEELTRRGLFATIGGLYLTAFGLKIAVTHGLGAIGEALKPDLLLSAFENFKKAISGIEFLKRAPWYGELCFIDMLIDTGRLDLLEQLFGQNTGKRNKQYLRGLCDRLERLACIQADSNARDGALKLLKGFQLGEIAWAKHEAIQQYASQSLNRLAFMWPTPDIDAMERGGYAPPAWHPFWSAQPSNQLLNGSRAKAQHQAKLDAVLSQLPSITSHNKQMQRLFLPTLSLKDVRQALDQYYQLSDLSIQRVSGDEVPLNTGYIKPVIVKNRAQREQDQKELMALDTLFESQTLRGCSTGVPKWIWIFGEPGIGKTTLCKNLVYEYQHNAAWQGLFDCVLWLPLRDLKIHQPQSLEELLTEKYFVNQGSRRALQLAEFFQQNHRDKTLFILDGLDEVVGDLSGNSTLGIFLRGLFNRDYGPLGQAHVVITSRHAGVGARQQPGQLDLELETIGFSPNDVKTYIQKFAPESNRDAIQQVIERTPLIQGLIDKPIFLDALCFSWDKLPKDREVTVTMLYEAMVDKLWRKDAVSLKKRDSDGVLLETHVVQEWPKAGLERLMAHEIQYLSYLAFRGLEAGKFEFSLEELNQHQEEFNNKRPAGMELLFRFINNLGNTSFLHTADAKRHYHFLHPTLQEFFAAKFLVWYLQAALEATEMSAPSKVAQTELDLTPDQAQLEKFIAQHKYNPRYEVVWWMVAGLLKKGAALERFFALLGQAPRDLIGGCHQRVMMGCLSEARIQLNKMTVDRLETELMQWLWLEIDAFARERMGLVSQLGSQRAFPEHLLLTCLDLAKGRKENIILTLGARSTLSADAISALITALKDEKGVVRDVAAGVLREQKTLSDAASQALIAMLQHESESARYVAAQVLGEHKTLDNDAISALIMTVLKDGHESVRSVAAQALGEQETLSDAAGQALVATLQHESESVRSAAATALGGHKTLSDAAGQALVATLQHESESVRSAAATALGGQETLSDAASQALIAALQDESQSVRSAAASALSGPETLSDATSQALIATLQNESKSVRYQAARALGGHKTLSDAASRALIAALQDEDPSVRSAAARALSRHKPLLSGYKMLSAVATALSEPITLSDAASQALVATLQHERESVRSVAAQVLREHKTLSDAASQALVATLQHERESVRSAAAMALGGYKTLSDAASQALIATLQHESESVRSMAAQALGEQETLSDAASQALIAALKDESQSVRTAAASALGQPKTLGDDAIPALIMMVLKDGHESVRSVAAQALGRQETLSDAASQALIAALQDESQSVRSAAASALSGPITLSDAASQALVAMLLHESESVRSVAAQVLDGPITLSDATSQALIAALQHEDPSVRSAAAQALGQQKQLPTDTNALSTLIITVLKDKNKDVRYQAARALGEQETLSDAVREALTAVLQDECSRWVRYVAAQALGGQETLSDTAIAALITALQDEDKYVRSVAAGSLDSHIDQLYTVLPVLEVEEIQTVYKRFLFGYSCYRIASLYIQGNQLHFYTATGPGQPIPLTSEQKATLIQAFRAVRAEA